MLKNDNSSTKIRYNLTQLSLEKQLNKEMFEGDFIVKEKEKEIIKDQTENSKTFTEEEKIKIFNEVFDKALEKIKKTLTMTNKKNKTQRFKKTNN